MVSQSLLTAFMFMDFWRLHILNSKGALQEAPAVLEAAFGKNLCSLQRALNQIGPWAKLIARPLALGMMTSHPQMAKEDLDAMKRLSRGENICKIKESHSHYYFYYFYR